MKRVALLVVMALMSLSVSARSVHYFTYSQAVRTVSYLNTQNEMMIYAGYEYELPTYVLINEVWMERINSSYYEIWVYGYDAYTGDEVYLPLDLETVWLYSGSQMYNAAQYLRFAVSIHRPTFVWHIPPYSPYVRVHHRSGYKRSYHYGIHRHGWMPPAYTYGPGMPPPPLPPYYMRHPSTPAPMPTTTWTPGSGRPTVEPPAHGTSTRTASGTTRSTAPTTPRGTRTEESTTRSSEGTTTRSTSGTTTRSSEGSTTRSTSGSTTRSSDGTTTRSSDGTSTRSTSGSTTRSSEGSTTRSTSGSTTRSSEGTTTRSSEGSTTRSSSGTRTTTPTRSSVETRSTTSKSREASTETRTSSTREKSTATTRSSSTRGTTQTRTR